MSLGANLKHHAALTCLAFGAMLLFASLAAFAVAVLAILRGQPREQGLVIGSTIAGIVFAVGSVWLVRCGVTIRRRAIEQGSRFHLPPENPTSNPLTWGIRNESHDGGDLPPHGSEG